MKKITKQTQNTTTSIVAAVVGMVAVGVFMSAALNANKGPAVAQTTSQVAANLVETAKATDYEYLGSEKKDLKHAFTLVMDGDGWVTEDPAPAECYFYPAYGQIPCPPSVGANFYTDEGELVGSFDSWFEIPPPLDPEDKKDGFTIRLYEVFHFRDGDMYAIEDVLLSPSPEEQPSDAPIYLLASHGNVLGGTGKYAGVEAGDFWAGGRLQTIYNNYGQLDGAKWYKFIGLLDLGKNYEPSM